MNKRLLCLCTLAALCALGCNTEQTVDHGFDCFNESKCIDDTLLATCINGEYKETTCNNGCDLQTNQCRINECDNSFTPTCKGNNRSYCENNTLKEDICPMICANGECVECTPEDVSQCNRPDNAKASCNKNKQCEVSCNFGYVLSEDKTSCEPFVCKNDDVSGCTAPENASPYCNITTCEDGEENCIPSSVCDFECNDKFVKTSDLKSCEAFVCNETDVSNCTELPEFASAVCRNNQCDFECDAKHIRVNNECIKCTKENTTQCDTIPNSTVSCSSNNTCKYSCQEGCYTWDESTNTCVIIDENHDNIPDCYDTVNCDAENVICLKTADDFLHLPDYFTSDGKVKSTFDGKYSGKAQIGVTFYLMNDINLNEIVSTSTDPVEKTCQSSGWISKNIKNLVLKTPMNADKRIFYQTEINGENINCTLNSSLWNSLENVSISHLKIELNVSAETAHSVLVDAITDSEMSDISLKGSFENTQIVKDKLENIGGIAGKAINTMMRRVYCDGCSVIAPQHSYYVGGVVGFMQGGEFSNEVDKSSNPNINKVNLIDGDHFVGGLIGKLIQSENLQDKVVVKNIRNEVTTLSGYEGIGGFIGVVQDAEIKNIENTIDTVIGYKNVGGLIGKVDPVCNIHDIVNTINTGVMVKDNQNITRYNLGGLIGGVHDIGKSISPSKDIIKTEIHKIEQKAINDNVVIQGIDSVGGLIGGINTQYNKNFSVEIYDISNKLPKVIGSDIANSTAGGFIGFCNGADDKYVQIKNITNDIRSVEEGIFSGGFVGYSLSTDFDNILNQFESIDCNGSCAGFVGVAQQVNINNINNRNIVNSMIASNGIRNINTYYDNSDDIHHHFGAGGFAGLIRDTSSLNNINNEIQTIQTKLFSAGGFAAFSNSFKLRSGSYTQVQMNHISNHVKTLKSEGDGIIGGFTSISNYCTLNNISNTIEEIDGKNNAGFINEVYSSNLTSIQSTVDWMKTSESSSGFIQKYKSQNSEFNQISSIIRYLDATKACQIETDCRQTGFINLDYSEPNLHSMNMQDIFSAVSMKTVSSLIGSGAVDFLNSSDLSQSAVNHFVVYANIEYQDSNVTNIIKDKQFSRTNVTPMSGSSIRFNAPDDTFSAIPDATKCSDMCSAYSDESSIDAIVVDFNTNPDDQHWHKGSIKLGLPDNETNVNLPMLDLKDIGFTEPESGIGYKASENQ